MDLQISGRTAIVTASSRGLGRASALALAEEGANVVISARGAGDLEKTAHLIDPTGERVHSVVCDVTDPDAPERIVGEAVERFGTVDILVANAGGPPPARALKVSDDQIDAAVNANLLTSVRLVRSAVPHMRSQSWGRICLITSHSIKEPIPTLSLSNTARTGLWAWAKTAASDLFDDGITLNLACPGLHATDRIQQLHTSVEEARIGHPEDFGKVVAFLCSEPAKFISSAAVSVDGATTAGLL